MNYTIIHLDGAGVWVAGYSSSMKEKTANVMARAIAWGLPRTEVAIYAHEHPAELENRLAQLNNEKA